MSNKKVNLTKDSSVILYTKSYCTYCVRAKNLLKSKNIAYQEIDIEHDEKLQKQVFERSNGRKTVPQIFIDDIHIGGYDDLCEFLKNIKNIDLH